VKGAKQREGQVSFGSLWDEARVGEKSEITRTDMLPSSRLSSLNSQRSEEGQVPMSADITVTKQRGRPFTAGTSGNPDGRPKGARNKLTEAFLDTVAKDFAENGAEAIERVRLEDPVMYLKLVRSLVPRELIATHEQAPDIDYAELTDAEIVELIEAERRRGIVQRVLQITAGR